MDKIKARLKGALKSLTIWFNTTGVLLLGVAMAEPMVATYLVANNFSAILIVGNLLLRFKTTSDLKDKQ